MPVGLRWAALGEAQAGRGGAGCTAGGGAAPPRALPPRPPCTLQMAAQHALAAPCTLHPHTTHPIPPTPSNQVMKIMPVQRMTKAGQRTRMKVGVGRLLAQTGHAWG